MITVIFLILIMIIFRIIITKRKKYFLTMVAIFKNEDDYLEEWLDFHVKQGFDHFYLYDNNDIVPNENTKKILLKHSDKVTHIKWNNIESDPLRTVQRKAYQNCVSNYNKEFQWLAIADIDEFIYSTNNKSIKDIIEKYTNKDTPSIRIPRFNYGDSFHEKKQKSVTRSYLFREKNFSSYKSINNIDYVDLLRHTHGVHRFLYTTDLNTINHNIYIDNSIDNPTEFRKNTLSYKNQIPLRMNHYYTKSKEEWIERCNKWNKKKLINYLGSREKCASDESYQKINKNDIYDHSILDKL